MKIVTSPKGRREIIENGETYKRVTICILIVAFQETTFPDLVQKVNAELPVIVEPKTIAEQCLKLQKRGFLKVRQ